MEKLIDDDTKYPIIIRAIRRSPKVLQQIEKVSYLPYPGFISNQPINVTSFENNFAFSMNVYAGPRINATVYF